MPPRTGKISSALNAFESTIQKNAESGEHSGMYISNVVGKNGGLSRSSHHGRSTRSSRRESSRSPTRNRPREGGGGSSRPSRSSSRSPTRTRGVSRVRGGNRSSSRSPSRQREEGSERGKRSSSRSPSRHRGGNIRSSSRSPSRHREGGGNRSSSRPRLRGGGNRSSSRSPSRHRSGGGGGGGDEARRAAERLKRRADKSRTQGRPRRKDPSSDRLEDSSNLDFRLESPGRRSKASDRSNLTETTGEMTLEELERPGSKGWNSFEDSANFFSEAEESTVGGDADDDFSIISESTFEQPDFNPNVKKNKKPDPNASWASGFAVMSYQARNDESDSESEERDRKRAPRSPGKDRSRNPARRPLEKSGSSRNVQKAGGFAVTYQHRADESDSDFDPEGMREKIRRKQLKASAPSRTLERTGSFKLSRSASSHSLGNDSGNEDAGLQKKCNASFLGDAGDFGLGSENDETEPSFESEHNMLRKTKVHGTTSRNDGWGDTGAFSSAHKPKPSRPARKYGAAAAADNIAMLPPAFQTIYRKQINEGKSGQPKRNNGDRRSRPQKEKNPTIQSDEAIDNAFSTDRSFFDCV